MQNSKSPKKSWLLATAVAGAIASLTAQSAHAANGTWINTVTGGAWSDSANWSGAVIADGSGSTADFSTLDITADNTVHLDTPRTLTNLTFGDTAVGTAASWILDNNGTSTNVLTLAGTTPTITVGTLGTGATTTISAIIAGTSGLTKAGAGSLILSGVNTYTGTTSTGAGTLSFNTAGALGVGALAFTNATGVAAVNINASQTITSLSSATNATNTLTIAGGSTLTLNHTDSTTLGGILAGGATAVLTKNGSGTLTLNQVNTFTGTLNVNGGGLTLDMSGANFTAATQLSLPAGAKVAVSGANVFVKIAGLTPVQEQFNLIVNPGNSIFTSQRTGSGRIIAKLSVTSRAQGGTIDMSPFAGSANNWRMAAASNVNGVVPWATATSSNWFAANSGGLNNDGAAYGAYTSSTGTSLGTALQNSTVVTDVTLSGASSINTIRFNDAAADRTITLGGSDTLTVSAGGILVTNTVANRHNTITGGTLMGGNPGSGSGNDLIIIDNNNPSNGANADFTIGSIIADNSTSNPGATALTKSGIGKLILSNTANTYTGKTFLNGGATNIAADGSLGAVPGSFAADNVTFTGGTLQFASSFNVNSNRGFTLNSNGGTIDTNSFNSTYSGAATGIGGLTKTGAGTFTLAANQTYTGTTTVNGGTLAVTSLNALSNTAIITTTGGTFSVRPGAGTVNLGSTSTALAGASITLNANSTVDMVDNAIGTANVLQSSGFTGAGLTIGAASGVAPTMRFEITGDGVTTSTDLLTISKSVSVGATGGKISIVATTGATALVPGNYNIITAASGLGVSNLTLSSPFLTVGSNLYSLSLNASTGTTEVLSVSSLIAAFWKGSIDGVWNTNSAGNTNWRTDNGGLTDTGVIPGSTYDVFFTVDSGSANYNTTLGADTSIKGLIFTGSVPLTDAASNPITIGGANTLTIGQDGISVQSGSAAHTISSALAINAIQSWTNNSSSSLTISGNLTGTSTNTLTLNGSGNVILSGATSTYAAQVNVLSGSLQIGATTILQNNTIDNEATNGIKFSAGISPTIGALTGAGGFVLEDVAAAPVTLTVGNNGTNTSFSGVLSGAGFLIKTGAGTLTLSATSTYTGGTTINQGTIKVSASSNIGSGAGTFTINAGTFETTATFSSARNVTLGASTSTIQVDTGTYTNSGIWSGPGTLNKTGAGTFALTGVNTFNGGININAGTLSVNTDSALGDAANNPTINAGTLETTVSLTTARNINLNNAASTIQVDTAGQVLTSNGLLTGTGSLTKTGSGQLLLNGTQTYAGNTTISAGSIKLAPGASINTTGTIIINATQGFQVGNATFTIPNNFTVSPGSQEEFDVEGSGVLNLTGNITVSNTPNGGSQLRWGVTSANATINTSGISTVGAAIAILNRGNLIFSGSGSMTNTGSGNSILVARAGNTVALLKDSYTMTTAASFDIGQNQTTPGTLDLTIQDTATINAAVAFDLNNINNSNAVTINFNGGTINTARFLKSKNDIGHPATLNLNGGTLKSSSNDPITGLLQYLPAFTGLTANVQVGGVKIDDGGFNITVNHPLIHDGAPPDGGLTKSGAGNLNIGGVNTYNGPTAVNVGTMTIASTGSVATSTTVSVAASATLNANGSTNSGLSTTGNLTTAGTTNIGANTGVIGPVAFALNSAAIGTAGTMKIASSPLHANRTVMVTPTLTVTGVGALDLNDNDLVIKNGGTGAAGTASLLAATALAKTGLENGGNFDWLGSGIRSTKAYTDNTTSGNVLYGIGVIQNNLVAANTTTDATTTDATPGNEIYTSFSGQTVALNDTLVKYTYMGDADLSGNIDFSDYSLIDAGFLLGLHGWLNGDFDYSGGLDFSDYSLIDASFLLQSGPLLASEMIALHTAQFGEPYVAALEFFSSSGGVLPEPGALSLLAIAGVGMLKRRRRN